MYDSVLCVIAFVDDFRHIIINELCEVIAAVRTSVRSVFDGRSRRADELFQVALGRQPALLKYTRALSPSFIPSQQLDGSFARKFTSKGKGKRGFV